MSADNFDNPYAAPGAALSDAPRPPGSTAKAVLTGVAIHLFGTLVGMLAFMAIYILVVSGGNVGVEAVMAALDSMPDTTSWIDIVELFVECCMLVLAGRTAARMARRPDYRTGWILAAIAVLLRVAEIALDPGAHAAPVEALFLASVLAAPMMGNWLALRRGRAVS